MRKRYLLHHSRCNTAAKRLTRQLCPVKGSSATLPRHRHLANHQACRGRQRNFTPGWDGPEAAAAATAAQCHPRSKCQASKLTLSHPQQETRSPAASLCLHDHEWNSYRPERKLPLGNNHNPRRRRRRRRLACRAPLTRPHILFKPPPTPHTAKSLSKSQRKYISPLFYILIFSLCIITILVTRGLLAGHLQSPPQNLPHPYPHPHPTPAGTHHTYSPSTCC